MNNTINALLVTIHITLSLSIGALGLSMYLWAAGF
jgi:hypothetical protein